MNNEQPDLAELITRIKDTHDVTETEIAKRIGVHVSSVNNWVRHKSTPRPEALRALAREFPEYTVEQMFAAAGRKTAEPVSPEAEQRLLELFKSLTAEQQEMLEVQLRGLVSHNRQHGIIP